MHCPKCEKDLDNIIIYETHKNLYKLAESEGHIHLKKVSEDSIDGRMYQCPNCGFRSNYYPIFDITDEQL